MRPGPADVWVWESADHTEEAALEQTDDGGLVLYVNDGGDSATVTLTRQSAEVLVLTLARWAGFRLT